MNNATNAELTAMSELMVDTALVRFPDKGDAALCMLAAAIRVCRIAGVTDENAAECFTELAQDNPALAAKSIQ